MIVKSDIYFTVQNLNGEQVGYDKYYDYAEACDAAVFSAGSGDDSMLVYYHENGRAILLDVFTDEVTR